MDYASLHRSEGEILSASAYASVIQRADHVQGDKLPIAIDLDDVRLIEAIRPVSHRGFDQIPMCGPDLLRQSLQLAPTLDNREVAFMGDSDGMSLLIGLWSTRGGPVPAALHLFDFDERLLNAAQNFASCNGFGSLLHVWRYNVFDPVPVSARGRCDAFVTNPPYGMRNQGRSARLFIERATDLIKPSEGYGAIILPDDVARPWTRQALRLTLNFMAQRGWTCVDHVHGCHRYHLDDDPDLTSDLILVRRRLIGAMPALHLEQRVPMDAIPNFYGRSTKLPYPRYIRGDGTLDFDWENIA